MMHKRIIIIRMVSLILSSVLLVILFSQAEMEDKFIFGDASQYGFTIEEIGRRLEYIYSLGNTLYFEELGDLPRSKDVGIQVFIAKGNRVLFLPEGKANTKVEMDGAVYDAYYSDEKECYLFYLMYDWEVFEAGVPCNSLASSAIGYCFVADDEKKHMGDWTYEMDNLSYLGETRVDFNAGISMDIPPIDVSGNGYIDAVAGYVSEILTHAEEYGEYAVYLNNMYCIQNDKRSYGATACYMDCVIAGNGRKEYAEFLIDDGNDIGKSIFPLSGPHLADSLGYFSDYNPGDENIEHIEKIIGRQRGVVTLEVPRRTKGDTSKKEDGDAPVYVGNLDFRALSAKDIVRRLSYVCSYSEWFGMAELGCRVGEFREFNGKEVILYSWEDTGNELFFIPVDKVNVSLVKADGEVCPVYVNEYGRMQFYKLEQMKDAGVSGQMDTSLITTDDLATYHIESFMRIGETEKIRIEELTKLEMPLIREDRFVEAFTRQVEELLGRTGKEGTYMVRIGEYESICSNKACISAAITGERDEYYIRYLIVGYGDDQYYFWPVGFGLDGSLEECASTSYNMNEICIDRTKLLNRTEIEIVLK